jgi:pSer/pThr/pTyr-binding forkhead associated (FHA) protein
MTDKPGTGTLPEKDPEMLRTIAARTKQPPGTTGSLGSKTEIMLLIDEDIRRYVVSEHTRLLLGRFDDTDHPDQVNLSPYAAHDKGVSRFHLQLQVQDRQLIATDLNSTNGSYLGGEPLTPNQPTIVRNGDILMLGRLGIQVLFR